MLYLEIKKKIQEEIKNEIYKQGEKLPSEKELCKIYNVSRSTIRETLRSLQNEGLVKSVNGVGTFITKQILQSNLNVLTTTKSLISNAGLVEKHIKCKIYEIDENIDDEWIDKLGADDKYLIIERVRMSDTDNIVYTVNVFKKSVCKEAFKDGLEGSVLEFLDKNLNIDVQYALSEICIPDEEDLYIKKAKKIINDKIMLLKQVHYDFNDNPIFYSLDYMNNNKVKFYIRRDRR